jgi:hypothetical protein
MRKKKVAARPAARRSAVGARVRRPQLTPARLLQLGMGFWGPRVLLSAVELGVFSILAKGALAEAQLRDKLKLHQRAARDFFDALVGLGILQRRAGLYSNAPDADAFLDRAKPAYVGGVLEMSATRIYPFWGSLTEALRTGAPQNETKAGIDPFATLYADPERLRGFLSAMTGLSMGAARAIAARFPWRKYKSFIDVGGAQGCVPVQIALAHKHISGGEFDLPQVGPIFTEYVRYFGLDARLTFQAGDFFRDPLPQSEVLIMGHILHDWNLEEKHLLLQKAYAALPKHGVLIVYDAMIDDARRRNVTGLLMSLNMLIETPGGFGYTPADCRGWLKATGFRRSTLVPLTAAESMLVASK